MAGASDGKRQKNRRPSRAPSREPLEANRYPPATFPTAGQGRVFNVARTGLEKLKPSRRSQLTDQVMTPRKVG